MKLTYYIFLSFDHIYRVLLVEIWYWRLLVEIGSSVPQNLIDAESCPGFPVNHVYNQARTQTNTRYLLANTVTSHMCQSTFTRYAHRKETPPRWMMTVLY